MITVYIYFDLLFLTSYIFNFFLLLLTSCISGKNTNVLRLSLGSLFGTLCIFIIFLKIPNIVALLIKYFFAKLMLVTTFKTTYKGYIKLTTVFYLLSFGLSGTIYAIENSLPHTDLLTNTTLTLGCISFAGLLIITIKFYINRIKNKNLYTKVTLIHDNEKIELTGYFDTGNTLTEPMSKLPVIIINKSKLKKFKNIKTIPIMCKTISGNGVIQAFLPDKLLINNIEEKAYIGICENMKNDNYDILLNNKLWGYLNAG